MISVIIPICRGHYLPRLLTYYMEFGLPYDIYVADSCRTSESEKNQELVNSMKKHLKIHYMRFDPEKYNNDRHLNLKIAQTSEKANTEFVVVCGDDDFIVPRAIDQGVQFLKSNPDYSIAHGHAVMMKCKKKANEFHELNPCDFSTWRYKTLKISNSDDPVYRLQSYFSNAGTTFYAIHRRLSLVHSRYLAYQHTNYAHFYEPLLENMDVIYGKVKYLDTLYTVRQISRDSNSQHIISWPDFLKSEVFPQEYERYYHCVTKALAEKTGLSINESGEVIKNGFKSYTTFPDHWAAGSGIKRILWRLKRIGRAMPTAIKLAFFRGELKAMLQSPYKTLEMLEEEMLEMQEEDSDDMAINKLLAHQSTFREDFLPIYKLMVKFPYGISS